MGRVALLGSMFMRCSVESSSMAVGEAGSVAGSSLVSAANLNDLEVGGAVLSGVMVMLGLVSGSGGVALRVLVVLETRDGAKLELAVAVDAGRVVAVELGMGSLGA